MTSHLIGAIIKPLWRQNILKIGQQGNGGGLKLVWNFILDIQSKQNQSSRPSESRDLSAEMDQTDCHWSEMEKDGRRGRAAGANFSQLCYFLGFSCVLLKVFGLFCAILGIFANFAGFWAFFAHILCAHFSDSKFSVCYFVSFFHLWLGASLRPFRAHLQPLRVFWSPFGAPLSH